MEANSVLSISTSRNFLDNKRGDKSERDYFETKDGI